MVYLKNSIFSILSLKDLRSGRMTKLKRLMVKFTHASEIKTCNDLSEKFWSLIIKEVADSDKLRIKFYRYVILSVKRAKRK